MISTTFFFIALIALSAFFSGIEIAYFSLSPGKVRMMVRRSLRGAKIIERLKKNPRRLLIVILIGNNVVNIFAAASATELSLSLFGSTGVSIATAVVTLLVLIFGEIVPKTFAQAHAQGIARYTAGIIQFLQYMLLPLVWIFEKITDFSTILTPKHKRPLMQVSEEEIKSLFHLGVEEGSVEKHESTFVNRLFRFNDIPVKSITTPIEKVIMLDGQTTIKHIANFAAHSGYSRFPVYEGSRANIIGVIHIKTIAKANNSKKRDKKLASLAQKPVFINEDVFLDDVLKNIQQTHRHYLIVRNRNKEITGLITLEDIIEELVGEIYDESDKEKKSVIT